MSERAAPPQPPASSPHPRQLQAGRFIVFEGGEGVGKSTQARLLVDALTARGFAAELTREPGGTPGAEAIRALLLNPPGAAQRQGTGWDMRAEALLFAAARADHVAKLIAPALAAGRWVICDRFLDSSRAYQGSAGGLADEDILALHHIGSEGLSPDLTFVLTASERAVAARLSARDGGAVDAIGGRDPAYHQAVSRGFMDYAAASPERYALIDAEAAPEAVHEAVMARLQPLLEQAQ